MMTLVVVPSACLMSWSVGLGQAVEVVTSCVVMSLVKSSSKTTLGSVASTVVVVNVPVLAFDRISPPQEVCR